MRAPSGSASAGRDQALGRSPRRLVCGTVRTVTEPALWGLRRSLLDLGPAASARPAVRAYEFALAAQVRPLRPRPRTRTAGLPLPPARLRAQVGPLPRRRRLLPRQRQAQRRSDPRSLARTGSRRGARRAARLGLRLRTHPAPLVGAHRHARVRLRHQPEDGRLVQRAPAVRRRDASTSCTAASVRRRRASTSSTRSR